MAFLTNHFQFMNAAMALATLDIECFVHETILIDRLADRNLLFLVKLAGVAMGAELKVIAFLTTANMLNLKVCIAVFTQLNTQVMLVTMSCIRISIVLMSAKSRYLVVFEVGHGLR